MRNISFTSGKGISTLITTNKETTTQRILKRAMVQEFCGSSNGRNTCAASRFFSPQKQIRRRNCIVAKSSSSFQHEQQRTIRGISLIKEGDNKNVHPSHVLCPDDFMPSPTDDEDATKFELPRKKIPIALVLAYVGDTFKGNTQNVMLPRGSTVDDVIEDAIYKAGGILFSNYRSKGLSRLKWSRSSRTDKGVSSLFTVVGLRMEAPVRAYGGGKEVVGEEKEEEEEEEDERKSSSSNRSSKRSEEEADDDAEAKALIVEKINRHLPTDTVKAFACFKATKSFDARRAAISRTYEYLLPLKCLRDDKNGELEMFREALKTFEGSHPFHNYTKRGLYGAGKGNDKNRKGRGNRNKKNALTEDDDGLGETSSSEEQELELEEEEKELPKRIETSGKHTYWLLEKDVDDLVHVMHYRRIHEFTCSKEPEIIEGFESYPFVRVKVYGESFMLHQIRKMIATAVLVALDSEETPTMPLSFIKASLCRPCRVVTPMAPPLTLFLTGAEFMSFRKTNHEEKTRAAAKVEEENESEEEDDKETEKRGGNPLRSLAISEETKNDIDRFRRERLYPKLAESFSNQDWDFFIENVQNVEPTREEYLNIVKQYESYDEMRKIRAKEKEEEEEEASMIEKSLL
jgi:tRNA pseudouridine38-40 synthase